MGKDWVSHIWGVLVHPVDPCIFMYQKGGGWTLPQVDIAERIGAMQLRRIGRAFEHVYGVPVVATCPLFYQHKDQQVTGIFALETRDMDVGEPGDGTWVDWQMVQQVYLKNPEDQLLLEAVFEEMETGSVPTLRVPWGRLGWYRDALAWFEAQIDLQGHVLQKPVEQVRVNGRTCLLRAETATGGFYFKVASSYPTVYGSEPVMVDMMHRAYPQYVPEPVAVDFDRGWIVFKNWKPLATRAMTPEDVIRAWQVWGQIQVDFVGREKELLDLGCPDRRLDVLVTQVDAFIEDALVRSYLDEATIRAFESRVPQLVDLCHRLADCDVPDTLVHGDFFRGNMALVDAHCTLHDWTDACLAHPFLEMKDVLDESDTVQQRIRDVYLAAWTAYAPLDTLQTAWELARPLTAFHHAVRNQAIAVAQEPLWRDGFDAGIADWTKKTLRFLP